MGMVSYGEIHRFLGGHHHLVPGIRRFLADEDPAATSCTVDIAWSAAGHRLDFDVEKRIGFN
jgi:hypothetical protein